MPLKRLVVEIDEQLHRRIKTEASAQGISMKDWLEPILEKALEEKEEVDGR